MKIAVETAGQQGGGALKALLAISLWASKASKALRPLGLKSLWASRLKKLGDGNKDSS